MRRSRSRLRSGPGIEAPYRWGGCDPLPRRAGPRAARLPLIRWQIPPADPDDSTWRAVRTPGGTSVTDSVRESYATRCPGHSSVNRIALHPIGMQEVLRFTAEHARHGLRQHDQSNRPLSPQRSFPKINTFASSTCREGRYRPEAEEIRERRRRITVRHGKGLLIPNVIHFASGRPGGSMTMTGHDPSSSSGPMLQKSRYPVTPFPGVSIPQILIQQTGLNRLRLSDLVEVKND